MSNQASGSREENGNTVGGGSGGIGGSGNTVGSAFAKMFSGTLVSRLLGMVRLIVLLAALGSMGAADAFNVANNLPNTIYNLLAGGVMNAILVPQIVRAMRRADGGAEYLNKLITLAGTILFVATVIFTVAAPLLVILYAGQMDPGWRAVAIAMSLWCIPELFFYGLYALFGNILNARGSFGPYMWAPVMNNVVSIAGLFVYMWVYGQASSGSGGSPGDWDAARIALVCGIALLGVASQALVLIPPLWRSGVRFRLDFRFRGAGLSGASRMAKWAFVALAIGQVGFLMLSNVGGAANGVATELQAAGDPSYLTIPTTTAYTSTFVVYMLPQSLVTTSLVTAIFTSMSAKAAAGDAAGVRRDMSRSLRTLGVFTMFAATAMVVLAIPVVQTVLFTTTPGSVSAFAAVLAALCIGIPGQSIWTVVQRVSFAYEDAKTLAFIQIPMSLTVVVAGFGSIFFLPPQWWLIVTALASSLSHYVGAVIGYLSLRTKLPSLDGTRVLRTHVRLTLASLPTGLVGWGILHLWGPMSSGFFEALLKLAIIGSVMLAVYIGLVRVLRVKELEALLAPFARILRRLRGDSRGGGTGSAGDATDGAVIPLPPPPPHTMGATGDLTLPDNAPDAVGKDESVQEKGTGGLLAGRYQLTRRIESFPTGAEVWKGKDLVLDRPVTVVSASRRRDSDTAALLLDSARRASMVEDNRFARLVDIGETPAADGATWAYVISVDPEGRPLSEYADRLDDATARAVVGETAAALEAARRRGVQHGALDPSLITVSDDAVSISGLAYLAVAAGTNIQSDDAVEASLQRSVADAEALRGLFDSLTAGQDLPEIDGVQNAGGVMRALAPWGEIRLPSRSAPQRTRARVDESGPDSTSSTEAATESGAASESGATTAETWTSPMEIPDTPPARILDPSSWSLHPGELAETGEPGFDELVSSDPGTDLPESSPAHVATALPAWKVLLPGSEDRVPPEPATDAPTDVPEVPTEGAPDGTGVVEAPTEEPTEAPTEEPTEQPTEVPDSEPGRARSDRIATAGAAAGAGVVPPSRRIPAGGTAAEKTPVGESPTVEQPVTAPALAGQPTAAPSATTLGSRVTQRIDTFAEQHNVRIPGEIPDPENQAAPLSRRRLDPGPFVLALVVALVAIATIFAFRTLANVELPMSKSAGGPIVTGVEKPPPPEPVDPTEGSTEGEPAPPAAPAIQHIGVLDPPPTGDGQENPDLTPRAWDGDPGTYWRSRSYVSPTYGMKSGIGLDVVLEQPAMVSEVVIHLNGEGGHVQVLGDPGAVLSDDRLVLGEAEMGRETVISFPEPVEMTNVVLWFTSLPVADSDGKNRVELSELEIR